MAELIVVDDEPDLRLMLAESLGAAGHEVRCAADGLELRRLLTDAPTDLVVLDVGLPGEDGFAVARWLPWAVFGWVAALRSVALEMRTSAATSSASPTGRKPQRTARTSGRFPNRT